MKLRHTITSVLLILMIIPQAFAGKKIDRSLTVPDTGVLLIDNTRGQVHVQGWDKAEVLLQGELDDSARKLIFKNKGHKTLIKVEMEGIRHHGDDSDLKIFVPRNLKLRFKGVDTSFVFADLNHGIKGHTINGDLTISNVHHKMNVSSISGTVRISDSSGYAQVESVTGEVDFSGEFHQAVIKSMSGDVTANIEGLSRLSIENVSGDTLINGHLQNKAEIKLTSVSGDIHYKAKGELNVSCNVASQFGGKIINFLTDDRAWSERLKERKLRFVSGDGSGKLVMNTVSGSVTLDK